MNEKFGFLREPWGNSIRSFALSYLRLIIISENLKFSTEIINDPWDR